MSFAIFMVENPISMRGGLIILPLPAHLSRGSVRFKHFLECYHVKVHIVGLVMMFIELNMNLIKLHFYLLSLREDYVA